ncbi:hypothetical protein L1766_06970 [Thermovorax subterraneus]|nr:hypothetical protein [Thermovorax subterraneus]
MENYDTQKDVLIPINEAQKMVDFGIAAPEYLLDGYSFHGAKFAGGEKASVTLKGI